MAVSIGEEVMLARLIIGMTGEKSIRKKVRISERVG